MHQAMSPLIEARRLSKIFRSGGPFWAKPNPIEAVKEVDLVIRRGEILGLVGESGSGKSTLARLLLRLVEPTNGEVWFDDVNISALPGREFRQMRRNMQIIFQDPFGSLIPRWSVVDNVRAPLDVNQTADRRSRQATALEMLNVVGISPRLAQRYPHELSGGQQQRVGIARALVLRPRFLVADEPVSALDVSVQVQILNVLLDVQERFALTMLLVSHDLSVVDYMSTGVAVLFQGELVEMATRHAVFAKPLHPYTRTLLAAIPRLGRSLSLRRAGSGAAASSIEIPAQGCRYRLRCPIAINRCITETPAFRQVQQEHWVRCHRADEELGLVNDAMNANGGG